MYFAVSCSIDPGKSLGRAVIRERRTVEHDAQLPVRQLFSYAEYCPDMRYGAFVQLWATTLRLRPGLALTDSTIFSSFCTFQPGKAELIRGMLDWLNHRSIFDRPGCVGSWPWSSGWSRSPVAGGLHWARRARTVVRRASRGDHAWLDRRRPGRAIAHRWSLPVPERLAPKLRVVIDRTVSNAPLSRGAYIGKEDGTGYGLFEQWIAPLGSSPSDAAARKRSRGRCSSSSAHGDPCPRISVRGSSPS